MGVATAQTEASIAALTEEEAAFADEAAYVAEVRDADEIEEWLEQIAQRHA